jgi:hypothetical protein
MKTRSDYSQTMDHNNQIHQLTIGNKHGGIAQPFRIAGESTKKDMQTK